MEPLDWNNAKSILDTILACNVDCGGFKLQKFKKPKDEIDYLVENLPAYPYVMGKYIDLMFSDKLTTGIKELDDEILNPFLFKMNAMGVTNLATIRQAIEYSLTYGKCGIRWLDMENGIVAVPYDRYTSLMIQDKAFYGFNKPLLYALSADADDKISLGKRPIRLDKEKFLTTGRLMTKENDIILVSPNDFVNLRHDTSRENGVSVLDRDKQRTRLLANVYQRLNYDIEYDGPGRLIFWLKDTLLTNKTEVSATEQLKNTSEAKNKRAEQAREEIRKLAHQIKDSDSDNVILASSYFDKFDHLPRVTKATEFLEYLETKEGIILSQVFGIPPSLIEDGDVSGNVSMEKILDNAMVNSVIPMREAVATQFSPMLSKHLGVPKVYFDKYELKDRIDNSQQAYRNILASVQAMNLLIVSNENNLDFSQETKSLVEDLVQSLVKNTIHITQGGN